MKESSESDFKIDPYRHFAFFVYLGIEYRNFFQSGLSSKLAEKADISLMTFKDLEVLSSELSHKQIKTILLDPSSFINRRRNKFESWFLFVRRAILKKEGNMLFRMFDDESDLTLKGRLFGNRFFYWFFERISWYLNKRNYFDEKVARKLRDSNVTDVVLQSYFSIENMIVAITAKSLGFKVWVVNWGWKDFYFHEYVPFEVDGFFTWSNDLKLKYLKYNKRLSPNSVFSIGNLSFDQMFNYSPTRELEYYEKKYNFPKNRIIVLYSMVNPVFCEREDLVVELIYNELKSTGGFQNLIFLVKPNPMDLRIKENLDLNNFPDIVYLDNLWHYDKANDFNLITEEGQTEWLDLLYYSKLNMSVASTVTVEALIMKKPVINILFGENGEINREFERFFHAPFYEVCHARPDVIACRNVRDVILLISEIINDEVRVGDLENIINSKGESVKKFISEVYSS
jgi:hypothetical protein